MVNILLTCIKDEKFKSIEKNRFEYSYIDAKNILVSFRSVNKINNEEVRDEMYIFNENNDTLFSYYDTFMPGAKKVSFFYYPSIQHSYFKIFVKLPFNDTIYSADSKNGFSPIAVLYCGTEKIPRHIAEDFSLNKQNREKYITDISSLVSDRYIFLSFYRKNAKYSIVFDREKNIVLGADKLLFENFIPKFRQIGINDDIEKTDINFFPQYINDKTVYDLTYYNFKSQTVNDNPTVIIGHMR